MPHPESLVGRQIDEFRLEQFIDAGSMGMVFRTHDTILNRVVALKLISKVEDMTPEMPAARKRIIREAQAAARLSHPNIVAVYRYGETDEFQYICMEFVTGKTLKRILDERKRIPLEEAIPMFDQILQGLDAAHQQEIVHRDIKPANIMIAPDGKVKVMDFGIARIGLQSTTVTGTVLGTPNYMSPEQITGQKADIRSDIFSLGAMLYHVLTGVKPFDADNIAGLAYRIMHTEPSPISQLDNTLPPSIEPIIKKALSKNLAERYETPASMREDLLSLAPGAVADGELDVATVFEKRAVQEKTPAEENIPALPAEDIKPAPPHTKPRPKEPTPSLPSKQTPATPRPSSAAPKALGVALALLLVLAMAYFFLTGTTSRPDRAQAGASLKVETNPAGTAVFVNGENKGRSPILIGGLPPGAVQLQMSLEGYLDLQDRITIGPGEKLELRYNLSPIPVSTISISSDPPGSDWYIDGTRGGITPGEVKGIAPGSHTVLIRLQGYMDWQQTVNTSPGEKRVIAAHMTPLPVLGGLEITTRPTGARVLLNGQESGLSPLLLNSLPSGTVTLRLSLAGFQDLVEDIAVPPGETARFSYVLKPRSIELKTPDTPLQTPGQPSLSKGPPFFMTRLVSADDLKGKSAWELDVMKNEIYARHGRSFRRKDLQDYFSRQPWYAPKYSPEVFSESLLSSVQQKNVKFIADYRLSKGGSD